MLLGLMAAELLKFWNWTVTPLEMVSDVLAFIAEQRQPRHERVVRLSDGESGLSSRTIKRRLSSVSGLYSWLLMLDEVSVNPVPRGLATRRARGKRGHVPLVRAPRTLPKVLDEIDVTEDERRKIYHLNAERLLKLRS